MRQFWRTLGSSKKCRINSTPKRFPSYLLSTLLLYFLFIFYVTRYTLPDFPHVSSLASLPFLSCYHNKQKICWRICLLESWGERGYHIDYRVFRLVGKLVVSITCYWLKQIMWFVSANIRVCLLQVEGSPEYILNNFWKWCNVRSF